jgi:hypothetical protein
MVLSVLVQRLTPFFSSFAAEVRIKPEKFEPILKMIDEHDVPEEREKMLFSLYQSVLRDENRKSAIENIMTSDICGERTLNNFQSCFLVTSPAAEARLSFLRR